MSKKMHFLLMTFFVIGLLFWAGNTYSDDTAERGNSKEKVSQEQGAQGKGNAYGKREKEGKEDKKEMQDEDLKDKDSKKEKIDESKESKESKEQGALGKGKAYGRGEKDSKDEKVKEDKKDGEKEKAEKDRQRKQETERLAKEEADRKQKELETVTVVVPPKKTLLVTFESEPMGAEVFLDRSLIGITPFSKEILFAVYSLEFRKSGYRVGQEKAWKVEGTTPQVYKMVLQPLKASFELNTQPSGATVSLNGKVVGVSPFRFTDLDLGTYRVSAKLDGYLPVERVIAVDAEQNEPVNLVLVKESGSLQLTSSPDQADVYLDGILYGKTPLTLASLSVGIHHLVMKKAEYSDFSRDVIVEQGIQKSFHFTLSRDVGILDVSSVPADGDLFIDGVFVGRTPQMQLQISKGAHQLLIRKTGYVDYLESFTVVPGIPVTRNVTLVQQKALLIVRSDPSAARIFISGKDSGVTPFISENLAPGTYTISLSKEGYEPMATQVQLAGGDRKDLSFSLVPKVAVVEAPVLQPKGILSVQSTPSEASISINGTVVGKTPYVTALDPGTYQVRLMSPGYSNANFLAVLESAKSAHYPVILRPLRVPFYVDSMPQASRVYLDDNLVGLTPVRMDLASGQYLLKVAKTNYIMFTTNLLVKGTEQGLSKFVSLKPESKIFSYTSDPQGAEVWYKNRVVGITPFKLTDVKDGTYELVFRKSGYRDFPVSQVISYGQPDSLHVVLEAMRGNLLVQSVPASADVYLDGHRVGISGSLLRDVSAGYHRLSVRKFGYFDFNVNVLIPDNMTVTNRVQLAERPKGDLQVNSAPAGARVTINNSFVGVTPYLLKGYPEGLYTMQLKLKGYRTYSAPVTIKGNAVETVNVTLEEGSACCLGGCFGSVLAKPAIWYTGAALLTALSGYSWYRMEQSDSTKTEFNAYRDVRDYSFVGALGCLATGLVLNLAF